MTVTLLPEELMTLAGLLAVLYTDPDLNRTDQLSVAHTLEVIAAKENKHREASS